MVKDSPTGCAVLSVAPGHKEGAAGEGDSIHQDKMNASDLMHGMDYTGQDCSG